MPARALHPSDFEILIDIVSAIGPSAFFNWTTETMRSELSQAQTLVWELDQKLSAFICYRDLPDFFEISVLGTSPEKQKQGLMLQLLGELQALAAKQRKSVLLEVHEQNEKALALYRRTGFKLVHSRLSYYSDGRAALVMSWRPE